MGRWPPAPGALKEQPWLVPSARSPFSPRLPSDSGPTWISSPPDPGLHYIGKDPLPKRGHSHGFWGFRRGHSLWGDPFKALQQGTQPLPCLRFGGCEQGITGPAPRDCRDGYCVCAWKAPRTGAGRGSSAHREPVMIQSGEESWLLLPGFVFTDLHSRMTASFRKPQC